MLTRRDCPEYLRSRAWFAWGNSPWRRPATDLGVAAQRSGGCRPCGAEVSWLRLPWVTRGATHGYSNGIPPGCGKAPRPAPHMKTPEYPEWGLGSSADITDDEWVMRAEKVTVNLESKSDDGRLEFPKQRLPGFQMGWGLSRIGVALLQGSEPCRAGLPRVPLVDSLCPGLTSGCAFGAKQGSVSTRGSMRKTRWGFGPGCRSQVMAVYPGRGLSRNKTIEIARLDTRPESGWSFVLEGIGGEMVMPRECPGIGRGAGGGGRGVKASRRRGTQSTP